MCMKGKSTNAAGHAKGMAKITSKIILIDFSFIIYYNAENLLDKSKKNITQIGYYIKTMFS